MTASLTVYAELCVSGYLSGHAHGIPHISVLIVIARRMVATGLVPVDKSTSRETHRISYPEAASRRYDFGSLHLDNKGTNVRR